MSLRALGTQFDARSFVSSVEEHGGASVKVPSGRPATKGYMAAQYGTEDVMPSGSATPEGVSGFVDEHSGDLGQPNAYLGGWNDAGKTYVDVSHRFDHAGEANEYARQNAQIATFNLQSYNDPKVPYTTPPSRRSTGRKRGDWIERTRNDNEAVRGTVAMHHEVRAGNATPDQLADSLMKAEYAKHKSGHGSDIVQATIEAVEARKNKKGRKPLP